MTTLAYSWEEILNLLTKSGEIICAVRLLDTIFINPQNHINSWYFTTKTGTISKKKTEKSTVDAITTRFNRFALSNPNNTLQYIGTIISQDGNRKYLTTTELISYFSSSEINMNSQFLQVYLRPSDGHDQLIRVIKKQNSENFQFLILSSDQKISSQELNSSFICDQCTVFMTEIMKSLSSSLHSQSSSSLTLTDLCADFMIDDNQHVWLSKISQAIFQQSSPPVVSESLSPDPSSTLPDLHPHSSQSHRTSPHISSSATATTTPSPFFSSSSANLVNNLLWREGGVYHCQVGPEGLPGLRAWVLTSLSKQQTPSHNNWMIDLNELLLPSSSSTSSSSLEIYHNRAKITRTLSNNRMLLLIEHFQPLLYGQFNPPLHQIDNSSNLMNFIQQWKLFLNEFQKKIKKEKKFHITTSEVTVDGNVHAICQKLQSLLDINFEAKGSLAKVRLSLSLSLCVSLCLSHLISLTHSLTLSLSLCLSLSRPLSLTSFSLCLSLLLAVV
jgi:hypothetical protein